MRSILARPPLLVLLVQGALYVVATATVLAVGIHLGFRLDEPKTITETKVLELPPACLEIEPELQAERARGEQLAEAQEDVRQAAADLADIVLSSDPDAIIESAKLLDTAKRGEQQLRLDLATAQTTTDAAVGACAPERAQ